MKLLPTNVARPEPLLFKRVINMMFEFCFDHSIHCQLMKSTSLQPVDEWGKDPLYSVSFSNFDLRLCSHL